MGIKIMYILYIVRGNKIQILFIQGKLDKSRFFNQQRQKHGTWGPATGPFVWNHGPIWELFRPRELTLWYFTFCLLVQSNQYLDKQYLHNGLIISKRPVNTGFDDFLKKRKKVLEGRF